jgi:hypothetical protein
MLKIPARREREPNANPSGNRTGGGKLRSRTAMRLNGDPQY